MRMGLRIAPTWPDVFIAPLSAPARRPPMSRHVPHAAPSRKLDEAPPRAISTAPAIGELVNAAAIVNRPAAVSAPPPTRTRPRRRPSRLAATSVVMPPVRSATTLSVSGNPERMAAVATDRPVDARYVGSHVT